MPKNNQTLYVTIAVIAFLIIGFTQGWFQGLFSIQSPNPNPTPDPNKPAYTSCTNVCSDQGFASSYSISSSASCKSGEAKVTYGYSGQPPLLTCCCYNAVTPTPTPTITKPCSSTFPTCGGTCPTGQICNKILNVHCSCLPISDKQHTCTETDSGNDQDHPGTLTYDGTPLYIDKCVDGNTLTEYWCLDDGTWQGGNQGCDPGEVCIQSRSGGYCSLREWHTGDTVFEGSGSASVIGNAPQLSSIDLSEYGIALGGNCALGAQLSTSWNYANNKCIGLPGAQGVKWQLYDSNGLEYERQDATPIGIGVDLHPPSHILDWDGHTKWRAIMTPSPWSYSDCVITYEYTVRIYIYSCS